MVTRQGRRSTLQRLAGAAEPIVPGTHRTPHAGQAERTVVGMDNRNEIRDFLTSRRARITLEQAGLPAYGGSRRVAGLHEKAGRGVYESVQVTILKDAEVRRDNGWFGGADKAPSIPCDPDVISEEDLSIYTAALARTGFFGPDSWYMNGAANIAYAAKAKNNGKLTVPVLFLHGAYDYTCETIDSRLAEPMRCDCADLTEVVVPSGHWMAQERPAEVNAALAKWLAVKVPDAWPA